MELAQHRPVRVGISACLLGRPVRFDGGHKRHAFLNGMLGRFVEWVPVCPEEESGLGTPREAMRLVRTDDGLRLLTVRTRKDLTAHLDTHAARRLGELATDDLCGFVLKKDSPSCGLERVKVYAGSTAERTGRGRFAAALIERFPELPVEEEGRLADPRLREHFVERAFAYRRLRDLFHPSWTPADLVHFHTGHKLLLMAHSPDAYRRIGRLVASAGSIPRRDLERQYVQSFMAAMSVIATPGRHANVLQHMAGYVTERLSRESRAELVTVIDEYRRRLVPLVVPLTLLRHHIRSCSVSYLAGQIYLDPHPRELMLRSVM